MLDFENVFFQNWLFVFRHINHIRNPFFVQKLSTEILFSEDNIKNKDIFKCCSIFRDRCLQKRRKTELSAFDDKWYFLNESENTLWKWYYRWLDFFTLVMKFSE